MHHGMSLMVTAALRDGSLGAGQRPAAGTAILANAGRKRISASAHCTGGDYTPPPVSQPPEVGMRWAAGGAALAARRDGGGDGGVGRPATAANSGQQRFPDRCARRRSAEASLPATIACAVFGLRCVRWMPVGGSSIAAVCRKQSRPAFAPASSLSIGEVTLHTYCDALKGRQSACAYEQS